MLAGYADLVARGFLQDGAAHYKHIQSFFNATGMTMVGLAPNGGHCSAGTPEVYCASSGSLVLLYATARAPRETVVQLRAMDGSGRASRTAALQPLPQYTGRVGHTWCALCFASHSGEIAGAGVTVLGTSYRIRCPFAGDAVKVLKVCDAGSTLVQ